MISAGNPPSLPNPADAPNGEGVSPPPQPPNPPPPPHSSALLTPLFHTLTPPPPASKLTALRAPRPTADVALLQLETPPNGKNTVALGVPQVPIVVGSRFTVAGIGVTIRGEGSSGGIIRVAGLVATGQPGTLQ